MPSGTCSSGWGAASQGECCPPPEQDTLLPPPRNRWRHLVSSQEPHPSLSTIMSNLYLFIQNSCICIILWFIFRLFSDNVGWEKGRSWKAEGKGKRLE